MSGQADIVKKASLKLKVVRSKTGAAGLQGPKVFKEFWFVFRALVGGDKILEYHQNEKKFQECAAYPKGVLHLGSALAVSYHNPEKKQQFSIELAGGSLIFLEAATQAIAREWMTCLNAVLFGKGNGPNGALQYFVEVPVGSRLQYAGPSLLEVKDEELTIKTNDGTANLVRWKLAHIRSFKAKKDTLTVFSGTRSSTGVGEYQFKTSQSVQITHAIETVVKKLKYEALGSSQQELIPQHSMAHSVSAPGIVRTRPFTSERRRPLPPPPPPTHPAPSPSITPPRTPSPSEISVESSMSGVPDHIPSEFISDNEKPRNRKYIPAFRTPEYSTVGEEAEPEEGYQRLDHSVRAKQRSSSPPQQQLKGYSRLSHKNAPALPQRNSSRSRSGSRSPTPGPTHPPSEEYGRLDHGVGVSGVPADDAEYGRLDHGCVGGASMAPGEGEYGKLDYGNEGTPYPETEEGYSKLEVPSPQKRPPPTAPPPYKPRPGSPMPELIRKLNTDEDPSDGPPDGEVYSEVAPSVPNPGVSEGYGRLNHHHLPLPPPTDSLPPEYSRLGATPNAPPIIDPYASLSDAHIQDLTEALRKEGEEGGDYSRLGVAPPPGHIPQVDSLGYSKPWTSYTKTLNDTPAPSNNTPKPSLNGIKTKQNGNGTAAVADTEFEVLYDKMEESEATPPPPPPRRGSLSRHSKSPPAPPTAGGRPPKPPKPLMRDLLT